MMSYIIYCQVCKKECKGQVPGIHLKTHGLSVAEYEQKFGPSRLPELQARCISGAKNGGGNKAATDAHKRKAALRKAEYEASPNLCKECSLPIPFRAETRARNFCNTSCSTRYHNARKEYRCRADKTYLCNFCGIALPRKGKFCNKNCQNRFNRAKLVSDWRKGLIRGGTDLKLSSAIRLTLIEEANDSCSKCGWSELHPLTGKSPLHIDHENGDCSDHSPSNLRVLCPNCHSLTNTFGGHNRNNKGRTVRRRERSLRKD